MTGAHAAAGVDWLTLAEACALLNLSPKALYHHVSRGNIPAGRVGRRLRFRRASLEAWIFRG